MTWLGALLGVDPELLRFVAALCSALGGVLGIVATVVGILNRRLRLSAKEDAARTLALVAQLVEALGVATPEQVRAIATEAAASVTAEHRAEVVEALAPVHRFFAAVELVEHRRQHRPETDVIRILEQERAAA